MRAGGADGDGVVKGTNRSVDGETVGGIDRVGSNDVDETEGEKDGGDETVGC